MTIKHDDDDDVLQDGQQISVPLQLMDHAPRIPAARVDDNFAMQGHRPGYVVIADAARSERIERQRAHDAELSKRWRGVKAAGAPPADSLALARARRDQRLTNAWRHR